MIYPNKSGEGFDPHRFCSCGKAGLRPLHFGEKYGIVSPGKDLRHRTLSGDDSHKAESLPDEKNNNSLDP